MKTVGLYIAILCVTLQVGYAQSDKTKLVVTHVSSQSFPRVRVSFTAKHLNGTPVTDLNAADFRLAENGKTCSIVSVKPQLSNDPISIGLVIDHSASMEEDPKQLYDTSGKPLFTIDEDNNMVVPDDYVAPIDHAKEAIKSFVAKFNLQKDRFCLTSFSSKVESPLTDCSDQTLINRTIEALVPEGKTALYDAMINGLNQMSHSTGSKTLVVLTDGHDNLSKSNADDVINLSVREGIPVYIIGLGKVQTETLQQIANETRGTFYYTESASSLNDIYTTLHRSLLKSYCLEYIATDKDVSHVQRSIVLDGNSASSGILQTTATFSLPLHTVASVEVPEVARPMIHEAAAVSKQSSTPWMQPALKIIFTLLLGIGIISLKRKLHSRA